MKGTNVQYFVEGDNEKVIVNTLKNKIKVIAVGKVQKFNVMQNIIPDTILRTLNRGTVVVLIFDTDTDNVNILKQNLQKLDKCSFISKVITIPQIPNLEGELVYSCSIRRITELLGSRSRVEFKSDLLHITNLDSKLKEHEFSIEKFWSRTACTPYDDIKNDSNEIKIV